MGRKFAHPMTQRAYDMMMQHAEEMSPELFNEDGTRRRNRMMMNTAFWNGYDGQRNMYIPTSVTYAAYAAGADFAKMYKEESNVG